MAKNKEKVIKDKINWKKELKLAPGYLILGIWVLITVILLGWVVMASLSTTKDIFAGNVNKFVFPTGLHFENFAKAWLGQGVATFFTNSLVYSVVSCTLLILVCAPAAYVLARFPFKGSKVIQTSFVSAMGVPVIMIVLPLFVLISKMGILNHILANRIALIILYVGINVPYTTIFLLTFFSNISRAFE
ncbi:MAG: carbohydrate ABC transporter permease, partial [Acetivibrio ethanolgignens]